MNNRFFASEKNCMVQAIVLAVVVFLICISFILMFHHSLKQKKIIELTNSYKTFECKMERLMHNNLTLVHGFSVYIKYNPWLDEEIVYFYLEDLLAENKEFIRNIGIIEDTTILWNYPRKINEEAIGVDLATIPEQRDSVLRVKKELRPILQGPINLIQREQGFSVRYPVIREEIGYWGQISIVLKGDRLLAEIANYAENLELDLAIFNAENPNAPFFGSVHGKESSLLTFNLDPEFINWRILINPPKNSTGDILLFIFLITLSIGISSFLGFLMCKYFKSNYNIRKMSTHDFLTGLFNRHFLDEYQSIVLAAAKREKRKVAVIMIDLDRIKGVNDTYGHGVGDMVLVETARILKKFTRANEAAFRLGGDEFLLIIPEFTDVKDLWVMKDRIRQLFNEEFQISGYPIKISLSIGCALFPDDGDNINALINKADKRLYAEKDYRN